MEYKVTTGRMNNKMYYVIVLFNPWNMDKIINRLTPLIGPPAFTYQSLPSEDHRWMHDGVDLWFRDKDDVNLAILVA